MLVLVLFTANAFKVILSGVNARNRKRTDHLLDIANERNIIVAARSGHDVIRQLQFEPRQVISAAAARVCRYVVQSKVRLDFLLFILFVVEFV